MNLKKYKTFLAEASSKNLHLEHLEDEVLNGGVNGTRGAIHFLLSLRDMLAGSSRNASKITVKWDGAPAVAAGIDPQSGEFFVSYKSMKKLCFTQQDVRDNFDGPLLKIYSALMEHLPKLKIPANVYQGDVLWYSDSQKKKVKIDGKNYLTFTPNTITYAVPLDSALATTIDNADVGIVFHTTYSTGGASTVDDLRASFGADTSGFAKTSSVWAINADFTDLSGTVTFTDRETKVVNGMLSEIGRTFNKVNSKFLNNIATDKMIKVLMKAYMNSKIREGEYMSNIDRNATEVVSFVKDRLEKDVQKLKSEKGRARKQEAADAYLQMLGGNMDQIKIIFKIMSLINNTKLYILDKLENVQGMTSTFIRTDNGYRLTKPEGFVAIDRFNNERGIKLVNRLEFSRANFNVDKNWDQ